MRLLRAYYLQVGPLTGDTSTLLLPSQGELFQQRVSAPLALRLQ